MEVYFGSELKPESEEQYLEVGLMAESEDSLNFVQIFFALSEK